MPWSEWGSSVRMLPLALGCDSENWLFSYFLCWPHRSANGFGFNPLSSPSSIVARISLLPARSSFLLKREIKLDSEVAGELAQFVLARFSLSLLLKFIWLLMSIFLLKDSAEYWNSLRLLTSLVLQLSSLEPDESQDPNVCLLLFLCLLALRLLNLLCFLANSMFICLEFCQR